MLEQANWITQTMDAGDCAVAFRRRFSVSGDVREAALQITALGVYDAYLNGRRVGDFVLAPGCTSYEKRLQVQTYDIAALLEAENELIVTVGKGWHRGRLTWKRPALLNAPCALIAELCATTQNGETTRVPTDERWEAGLSNVIFNDLWDGETCDATQTDIQYAPVEPIGWQRDILIPQEGSAVREQETVAPRALIITPKGERVLDFGQEITGYPAFSVTARAGDRVRLSCAEMLDKDGNFYADNYRKAKSRVAYLCKDGAQRYQPRFTFYGFRYLRVDEWPGAIDPDAFRAIVLHSDMERTGFLRTTDGRLNRLIENTVWSQRGNFVDIPTDCPQRDERMGWTGDAQVFAKTACYHYDTKRFFEKWLGDVRAEQRVDGSVPDTVPNFWNMQRASAAWGDVITVLPWQLYLMFGDIKTLENNFDAMRRWVDYITADTRDACLWTAPDDSDIMWQKHYGDWLALDAAEGSYRGATPNDLVASAYYAHSAALLIKAGRALGRDMAQYETLHAGIQAAFKKRFALTTQTAHVLALAFDLTDDKQGVASDLARMIRANGDRLQTGFVGTPHLLRALSDNGFADVAYDLLMQDKYPSWLYEVDRGATTIWEHWDGVREDGAFWSADMNSFNHYAYGTVAGWLYEVAGGIRPDEKHPGFARAIIAPVPSARIQGFEAEYRSARGTIISKWTNEAGGVRHEITTPVPATLVVGGITRDVLPGRYLLYS